MSTTEPSQAAPVALETGEPVRRRGNAVVPASGMSGTALVVVIAIMAFLAAITIGLVIAVSDAADGWAGELSSELTIQVVPVEGRDVAVDAQEAARIAAQVPGVVNARVLEEETLRALLEPWLGADFDIEALPVPRLVVVTIDRDSPPASGSIGDALADTVPTASIDDHQVWQERLKIMANTIVSAGTAIFVLVLAATVLSIVFATRSAIAANRNIVQVLHLVGAREGFIAWQFVRHFLLLGLKGGAAGGAIAVVVFVLASWFSGLLIATPAGAQLEALFGSFGLSGDGYIAIAATVLLVAGLTALTAYVSVLRVVRTMV